MEPGVSVIVPILNEGNSVSKMLKALISQDYPGDIEIVVVDGGSTDGTLEQVTALMDSALPGRAVLLLHNPKRLIPFALNLGYGVARHDYLLRMDGHAYPRENYVTVLVRQLTTRGRQVIVGGRCQVTPPNAAPLSRAIAGVLSSPLGVGNAYYKTALAHGGLPQEVDTVPFGAFHRSVWQQLGGFDEKLPAAEDYDFNLRARGRGLTVWLIPEAQVVYEARDSFLGVCRQYFRYGYWTCRMCLKHRRVSSARKAAPALFLLALASGPIALRLSYARQAWGLMALVYVAGLVVNALGLNRRLGLRASLWAVILVPAIHIAYGTGTLVSLLRVVKDRGARGKTDK